MRDGEGGVHDYSAPRSLDRMDAPRSGANGEQRRRLPATRSHPHVGLRIAALEDGGASTPAPAAASQRLRSCPACRQRVPHLARGPQPSNGQVMVK